MHSLDETELEILEECAGRREARPWGAAVGACLGKLRNLGLITRSGQVTAAGFGELARLDEVTTGPSHAT